MECELTSCQVFGGDHSPNIYTSLRDQMALFSQADIIIGPHGAGLANMMWCQDGTSVIEFPLVPYANRNLGMLAMAAGMDYYLLPEISANYHLKYHVTREGVDAAVALVRHIIEKKGLQRLYAPRDEL